MIIGYSMIVSSGRVSNGRGFLRLFLQTSRLSILRYGDSQIFLNCSLLCFIPLPNKFQNKRLILERQFAPKFALDCNKQLDKANNFGAFLLIFANQRLVTFENTI